MCKLGFLALVACAVALFLSGLGRGHEHLLFLGTIAVALVVVAFAELGQWLAWRLDPFARVCLLGLVALLDVLEVVAAAVIVVLGARGV